MGKMFTGIIEEIGTIKDIRSLSSGIRLQIRAEKILADLTIDHSVSVNGVCLTVVEKGIDFFCSDVVAETLERSTLIFLKKDDPINLERALRLQDRLGGHLIQGHVDGVGTIRRQLKQPWGGELTVEIPPELEPYTIPKGSIAIDGISLTIAQKKNNMLTLAIIPHTFNHTILQFKNSGDRVNIEVDFFAKYIEQFMTKSGETKITWEWLKRQGY